MNDQTLSLVEWDWDGRHPSCQHVTRGIQEPDRELRQGYPEIVNRLDIGLVCDIWSRELGEGTCEFLNPSFGRPEIERAPHPDRYDVWAICSCCCDTPNSFGERVVSSTRSWKPPRSKR